MKHSYLTATVLSAVFASTAAMAADPAKIDWSKIPAKELTLFYPGQSSWEWMISAAHKAGAIGVRDGKNCNECHTGEEKDMGDVIVSGKKLEPKPLSGKPGSAKVAVQAAFDSDNLYLRAQWADDGVPGVYYPAFIFKNGKWEKFGNHRGEDKVATGAEPAVYEDRISFMFGDDNKVPEFKSAGCWVTCHNDLRYMPNHPKKDEVEAHVFWGKDGAKKSDMRKYLKDTRTSLDETGGWKNPKSKEELTALKDKGYLLDLLQWRAHRSDPIGVGDDGFVGDYRNFDAGKKTFTDNWDKDKNEPKWMFSGAKPVLAASDLLTSANMMLDSNIAPYDAAVAAKEGAVLPQWLVTSKVEGSAADIAYSKGAHDGKGWTVVMARKLATGNKDDVQMAAGQTYTLGLSFHDDNTTARWHFVSFPATFSLGKGDGVINAVQLK
ncbi:MAG: hypothetical protein A3G18_07395 [Rhodospirillales bacterium RIFCSPLOWO2_12_FULL_58_28]|nr:MAG: hypothetical protein A3H92_08865 [Rhodospirillales bacterium RIFCSPLOWO2_02_FULL_58_16]OHC77551.1 MAG: hypothetical protein A3G18_07395 [Rhodospirillales bacterium RIFCSPLOWO2_12_FULL_58_28]